ncbi:hypothetical protein [Kitasatospora sp. NPDC094011]|uniref:hypothetical protein n=1 Tax=Kitasatospora sp. NPDC094011 TaxID=3364090 RepID=UPI0037F1DC95
MYVRGGEARASWCTELAHALRDRKYEANERDLGWVEALDQLREWLGDSRPYKTQHRRSWESVIADFAFTTSRLPGRARSVLGVPLADLSLALGQLPEAQGEVRARAVVLAGSLDTALASTQLLGALWNDLVEMVQGPAEADDVIGIVRMLRILLHRSNRDADRLFQVATGILYDQATAIRSARVLLGEQDGLDRSPKGLPNFYTQPAGLPHSERADLCRRVLEILPRDAHHIVWHAFDNARIGQMVQEFGPVTLYHRDWLYGTIVENGPHKHALPAEISSPDADFPADLLPEGRDVVIARVDLGVRARAVASVDSRLQARSLVAAASFPEAQHGWQMFNGYIHFGDGYRTDEFFSKPEEDRAEQAPFGHLDVTARRLSELAPRVIPFLPEASSDLAAVIDAIGWWKSTGVQPAHPAVILDVRILEILSAATSGGPWYDFLDCYYKNAWIHTQIADRLVQLAWHALDQRNHLDPQTAAQIERRRRTLVLHEASLGFRVDLAQVIASLPFLAAVYPENMPNRRRATDLVHRFADSASRADWYSALEGTWSRAVCRLRSVRNSLAHGGPSTTAAVATVAPFAHGLAGNALLDSLTGLIEGHSQEQGQEGRRDRADRWARQWLSGASAAEAFSNTPS